MDIRDKIWVQFAVLLLIVLAIPTACATSQQQDKHQEQYTIESDFAVTQSGNGVIITDSVTSIGDGAFVENKLTCCENPESTSFNFGRFNFFMSQKQMDEGSISDMGFGFAYTEKLSGELRFRNSKSSKNEEFSNTADSLNAINETVYEFFITPAQYQFVNNDRFKIWAGGGFYYQYDKLFERGFFNLPSLETLVPPRERVNSYANDFSMHLVGPLLESGISFSSEWFKLDFSGSIVPVFFLHSKQKTSIVPLLDPHYADHSQNTSGNPNIFLTLDSVIFKYVNITLLYDYTRLKYQFIDFDENLHWISPERKAVIQSFKIEASGLIPLSGDFSIQAGYGFSIDSTKIDAEFAISDNKHYLILSVKKTGGTKSSCKCN